MPSGQEARLEALVAGLALPGGLTVADIVADRDTVSYVVVPIAEPDAEVGRVVVRAREAAASGEASRSYLLEERAVRDDPATREALAALLAGIRARDDGSVFRCESSDVSPGASAAAGPPADSDAPAAPARPTPPVVIGLAVIVIAAALIAASVVLRRRDRRPAATAPAQAPPPAEPRDAAGP